MRHQYWLGEDMGGGISRKASLTQAVKSGAAGLSARLQGPPPPPLFLIHLVDWLEAALPVYGEKAGSPAPSRLGRDIEARFGYHPRPWEIALLTSLLEVCRAPSSVGKPAL